MMDYENAIEEKSFEFAVRIVNLTKYIRRKEKEFVLTKQLLRCGTSIGAMCQRRKERRAGRIFIPR